MRQLPERLMVGVLLAGVAGAGYLLKAYYSQATPSDLRWILLPTGALVQSLSGHQFQFEPGIGVASSSAQLAITRACAGVNFLIVLFAALAVSGILRLQKLRQQLAWLGGAAAAAYALTLLVNTLRILVALELHREHRLEGTVIYLVSLCVAFTLAQQLLDAWVGAARPAPPAAARWLLLPIGLYLGITLVVPAMRGAAHGGYWSHALIVLGVTCVVGGLFWLGWAALVRASATPRLREPTRV